MAPLLAAWLPQTVLASDSVQQLNLCHVTAGLVP